MKVTASLMAVYLKDSFLILMQISFLFLSLDDFLLMTSFKMAAEISQNCASFRVL